MSMPVPSLPVAGIESPPVAMMTREARRKPPLARRTFHEGDASSLPALPPPASRPALAAPSGSNPFTYASKRISTPFRSAIARKLSRTSFALFETGKSFPVSSSRAS